jgi:hypothetical protein
VAEPTGDATVKARERGLWRLARDSGETRGEALVTVIIAVGTGSVMEAREAYRLEELMNRRLTGEWIDEDET